MFVLNAIGQALQMAFFMFWEVLWPLALGFIISAVVQTVVSKEAIVRTLGKDDLRGVTFATLFGAASSSCSYAAVAIARGLFRRGATLANAILFEFASTNLVFELGIVLLVLLGWQFVAAEFAGGLLMIGILSEDAWRGTARWTCPLPAAPSCAGCSLRAHSPRSATTSSGTSTACGRTSRSDS